MRIAALYIPEGYKPHLFGKEHKELTINFGGRNLYTVSNKVITDIEPNPYYLEDIFEDGITLFSCIVGNNGGGKTTLLKMLSSDWRCYYVMESEIKEGDGAEKFEYCLTNDPKDFHRIYYTPYLGDIAFNSVRSNGKDLSKYSLIKNDNHGDSALLEDFLQSHFSESLKRWIKFNQFFLAQENKKVSLPTFQRIILTLKHFDLSIHQPDKFHDTAYQLRGPIQVILKKIKSEAAEQEAIALDGHDLHEQGVEKFYFPVRFKYDLYELALAKLVSIFERRGNRYLQEGIIPENYKEHLQNLNVRESIEWFLGHAGVHSGRSNYYLHGHSVLLVLLDYITGLISSDRVTDDWREMVFDQPETLQIIELFDEFNKSFQNEWFEFDWKPMFDFRPDVLVSSGEQSFLNLFSTLYYHASNIRDGIDIDEYNSRSLEDIKEDILLLLDEGDNAFHPQWKKAYVKYLRDLAPIIFKDFNIQIMITSHDPLTLSDIPKNNVVYLERNGAVTRISASSDKKTYGANIADLLKDSFFIQDGQIGDFVAGQIDKVIQDINSRQISSNRRQEIERIIQTLDEPILKFKLAEMLSEALGDKQFELDLIDEEIRRLEHRKGRQI